MVLKYNFFQFIEDPEVESILTEDWTDSDDDYKDYRRKRKQAAGLIFHPLKETLKAKRQSK
jgi:hypothetical protein